MPATQTPQATDTITVNAHGYTATLCPDTQQVEILDDHGHWAGTGRWDGHTIADCPAVLGGDQDAADEIYEALDAAMIAALPSIPEPRLGWCDGSGPEWGDTPCGASHHDRSEYDVAEHACEECCEYTPGAMCHPGGLCPECILDTAHWYRDGELWVAVYTVSPDRSVHVGVGETREEAFAALDRTPIQVEGRAIDRALAWAHGAEWISSPDLTEADVDTGR